MKNSSVSSSARRIALTHSFSTSPRPKLKCKRKLEVLFFKIQPNPISQRRLDLNTAHGSLFWFNLELLLSWVFFFFKDTVTKGNKGRKQGKIPKLLLILWWKMAKHLTFCGSSFSTFPYYLEYLIITDIICIEPPKHFFDVLVSFPFL